MERRQILIVICMLLCASWGFSQEVGGNAGGADSSVQAILNDLKAGLYTGIGAKQLERLGDNASLAAIRSSSLEEIANENTGTAIARMITIAFSHPELITSTDAKTPKVSIILLTYIRSTLTTAANKKIVDEAITVVSSEMKNAGRQQNNR